MGNANGGFELRGNVCVVLHHLPLAIFQAVNARRAMADDHRLAIHTHILALFHADGVAHVPSDPNQQILTDDAAAEFHVGLFFKFGPYGRPALQSSAEWAHVSHVIPMRPNGVHRGHVTNKHGIECGVKLITGRAQIFFGVNGLWCRVWGRGFLMLGAAGGSSQNQSKYEHVAGKKSKFHNDRVWG